LDAAWVEQMRLASRGQAASHLQQGEGTVACRLEDGNGNLVGLLLLGRVDGLPNRTGPHFLELGGGRRSRKNIEKPRGTRISGLAAKVSSQFVAQFMGNDRGQF